MVEDVSRGSVGLRSCGCARARVASGSSGGNGQDGERHARLRRRRRPALPRSGARLRRRVASGSTTQIFEGLVGLKPGTTKVVPEAGHELEELGRAARPGRSTLRKGVKFTDGTPFNAAAVCFNFNRWYNFTGSFQNPSATYYCQTVFGGFEHTTEVAAPEGSALQELQGERQLHGHDQR